MKKILLSAQLCVTALLGAVATATAAPKPNILHILVDDLGWQDIASHKIDGKPVYETPNLDRLTKMSRRFTQAYSPAPSCAPSRVAFLRGRHPVNTGVYHVQGGILPAPYKKENAVMEPFYRYGLPNEEPTLPDTLKKAGYFSGHIGKWHSGGKSEGYPFPVDQGFDFGFLERDYNDKDLWNPKDGARNQFFGIWKPMKAEDRLSNFATDKEDDPFRVDADGRPYDKLTDMAVGFMDKYKDRPFFLNFATLLVHGPIQTRDRKRFEHYLAKMGYEFPTDPKAELNQGKGGHTNPYYASMLDSLDWMVGKFLDFLETTDDPRNPGHKLIDNTYVILDSDNGGVLPVTDNAPLRGGKQNTYEGGVRIPFLVAGPGVPAGTTCDTPITLVDLFPTFLEVAGLKPDPALQLDGSNILPQFHGASGPAIQPDGTARESIYWFFPFPAHMSAAIRKGDWKLVRNYGINGGSDVAPGVELYRLYNADGSPNDLGEKQNLSEKEPARREELLAELDSFLAKNGARLPYKNPLSDKNPAAERDAVPAILARGSDSDVVWATFETGKGKSPITEATLLYTLNPAAKESGGGDREEWLFKPARILDGRVEAEMPPGATHAAFVLLDSNRYCITSEPLPDWQENPGYGANSKILKDGYAWKPGLSALIKLGERAAASAAADGKNASDLLTSIEAAKTTYSDPQATESLLANSVRHLRAAIRHQKGTPESRNEFVNRFPYDPKF